MTTFRKKLSELSIDKNNDYKQTKKKKKPSILLRKNSESIKRQSVYVNNKKNLLFRNVLAKQKNDYSSEENEEYNKVLSLLIKEPYNRTNEENREIGDFLSKKYISFKTLKDNDEEKYDVIINISHLKRYSANNIIINYENLLDKAFFLLEGKLSVYKRIFIRKLMTQEKFKVMLSLLNNKENSLKYERIKEKNKEIISEFSYLYRNKLRQFYVEENKKLGDIEEGQNFGGKIEDINEEKKNSDVMVKTDDDSYVLFFYLDYYKKILDKIERKKFNEEIEKHRSHFILFKHFSDRRMIEMIKNFTSVTLYQDEYLYHQNEPSDYIYFITKGKFIKYVSFSFNWLYDYLNYIKDATTNIIYHLVKIFPKNQLEHNDLLSELETKKLESPMVNEHLSKIEELEGKTNEKYVYGIKSEEENINNKQKIFRIKLEEIGIGDIPGIEDGLEFKNRYYSLKCISEIAEVRKIKISDFLSVIKIYKTDNNEANNHILGIIAKKKFFLYHQIIKNAQNLEIKITSEFDNKYNNLIEQNKIEKSDKNKNLSIAAIKAKGYKYEIKEIFDKEIPIFPTIKKSFSENYYLQNQKILKNLYENPDKSNKRIFKFKNQNRNLTLSLSDQNYFIPNRNTTKYFFSENNFNSIIKFNNDKYKYNSPKSPKRNRFNITLSTNFSKFKSVKKVKRLKTEIFNHKLNTNKELIIENSKNEHNENIKCIESSLYDKFKKFNKKYYMGNQFKKKLDGEKKKFNLIQYKEFFNK